MPKLPVLSGSDVLKILRKMGFEKGRQKGSHVIMKKVLEDKTIGCVVPMHKEVARGTLHNILRQAQIEAEEFLENV